MKKLLTAVLILICLTSCVMAKTIKVMALDSFSTQNPSSEFRVKTLNTEEIYGEFFMPMESVISGSVIEVHKPKRGKLDGFFEFQLNSYNSNGEIMDVSSAKIEAVVVDYEPIDPKALSLYVARKATNIAFKGASLGIAFVEGAAKAESGKRIKSGFIGAYKDSPLSYLEYGDELNVQPGDILVLKLKKLD